LVYNQPLGPTQPPIPGGVGNEYQRKWGDALCLGSKGRIANSIRG